MTDSLSELLFCDFLAREDVGTSLVRQRLEWASRAIAEGQKVAYLTDAVQSEDDGEDADDYQPATWVLSVDEHVVSFEFDDWGVRGVSLDSAWKTIRQLEAESAGGST